VNKNAAEPQGPNIAGMNYEAYQKRRAEEAEAEKAKREK